MGISISKKFIELSGGSLNFTIIDNRETKFCINLSTKSKLCEVDWKPNNRMNYFLIKYGPSMEIQQILKGVQPT
jgi:phosphotransferase system IIB component